MLGNTQILKFASGTNFTAASFTPPVDQTATFSILNYVGISGREEDGALEVHPVADNANGGTIRVYGQSKISAAELSTAVYHLTLLAEISFTCGDKQVGGSGVTKDGKTLLYANTLAVNNAVGTQGVNVFVITPTSPDASPVAALVDLRGYSEIVVTGVKTGSSTAVNALLRGV